MRTFYRFILKNAAAFLVLFLAFSATSLAQLPQYYNYNTNGENNSFPFNQSAGKMVQYLFLASEFNTPSPAPAGFITKFSFRIGDIYPLNHTYTSLYIRMGQTAITVLPASFYAGTLDTVWKRASHNITAAGGTWYTFNLDRPFLYDPTMSLVVEIGQCAAAPGTGFSVCNTIVPAIRRTWSLGGCPFAYGSQNARIMNAGISVVPATPQHYNFNTGTGVNTYPFGQPLGQRVNWLIRPATLILPTPILPGGSITAIYFWMGNTATGTFTDLYIRLGQSAITTLPGSWYAGTMDTVFKRTSVTLSSVNNAWMLIPLNNPIPFDVAQSLIIDVEQCGVTPSPGLYVRQSTGTPATRNYGTVPAPCPHSYIGQDGQIMNFGVAVTYPVGVNNNNNEIPNAYKLEQNYPNPFNPVTNISFAIPKAGNVKLVVYDMLGREVYVLVNEFKTAGSYSIDFDASELSSGAYFYKIEAGDFRDTKKMMLVK